MGYESRIYVARKSKLSLDGDGKCWGEVVAMFNACKFPGLPEVFKRKTDCFIYADDDDTRIIEDQYGNELTEAPLADVVKFLEDEVQRGETYRRIKPLLGLLKSFDMEQWDNLVCLHYGY